MAICATSRTGKNWCQQWDPQSSRFCFLQGSPGGGWVVQEGSTVPHRRIKCSKGAAFLQQTQSPAAARPSSLPSLDNNKQAASKELDVLLQNWHRCNLFHMWRCGWAPTAPPLMWCWCSLGWTENWNPRPAVGGKSRKGCSVLQMKLPTE